MTFWLCGVWMTRCVGGIYMTQGVRDVYMAHWVRGVQITLWLRGVGMTWCVGGIYFGSSWYLDDSFRFFRPHLQMTHGLRDAYLTQGVRGPQMTHWVCGVEMNRCVDGSCSSWRSNNSTHTYPQIHTNKHTYARTHTHTHSLSLSLTHTHTVSPTCAATTATPNFCNGANLTRLHIIKYGQGEGVSEKERERESQDERVRERTRECAQRARIHLQMEGWMKDWTGPSVLRMSHIHKCVANESYPHPYPYGIWLIEWVISVWNMHMGCGYES